MRDRQKNRDRDKETETDRDRQTVRKRITHHHTKFTPSYCLEKIRGSDRQPTIFFIQFLFSPHGHNSGI